MPAGRAAQHSEPAPPRSRREARQALAASAAEQLPQGRHIAGPPDDGGRTVVAACAGAVGLGLALLVQFTIALPMIESRLGQSVREELTRAGISQVTIKVSGRDITLLGAAADPRAALIARRVTGVRAVALPRDNQ